MQTTKVPRRNLRDDPAAVSRFRAAGLWPDRTVAEYAADRMAEDADRVIIVDADKHYSRRDIYVAAQRLAANLLDLGLKQGDVISFQLPNWHEAAVVSLAAAIGGFVLNPIVPIYRDLEVKFMLADCGARALFIPAVFRGFDYAEMVERLRETLPELRHVIVVHSERHSLSPENRRFEDLTAPRTVKPFPAVDPDALKMIMYTSGTTGRAKGVLHSHNTLGAEVLLQARYWGLNQDDTMFMPSPVSHITGVLTGLEMPWITGMPVVLQDSWNAERAIELIRTHGATIIIAATPFLKEILDVCERTGEQLPTLRYWPCGGAPVPADLVRRGHSVLRNCLVFRVYGSTELPTITYGVRSWQERDLAADTDGEIFECEVKIVDAANGTPLPPGAEGEILARGLELFLGYLRDEDNETAFDEEGYFRTGDLGQLVNGNRLLITGRKKDLIIRGGENLSAKEIEDAMLRFEPVSDVAVVAMPSERMGEAVCAFVVANSGRGVTLAEIAAHLQKEGLARQKIPEHVELVETLPRTASGKVRKDVLREAARKIVR